MDAVTAPPNQTQEPVDNQEAIFIESRPTQLALVVWDTFDSFRKNREQLGIDKKWERNWNAYQRVSDEFWKAGEAEDWRSDTFLPIIKSSVMMAYALIIDMVLQGGQIPFKLDLGKWQGVPLSRIPPPVRDALEQAAKSLQDYIQGALAQGQADRQISKNVLSSAIYGESYAKIVVRGFEESGWNLHTGALRPEDAQVLSQDNRVWMRQTTRRMGPAIVYVQPWDIYRDLEVEQPRDGHAVIHRQLRSNYWLRQRKGQPFYIDDAIDRVIAKQKAKVTANTSGLSIIRDYRIGTLPPTQRYINYRKNTEPILEFWGRVHREVAEEFESVLREGYGANTQWASFEQANGDEVEITATWCAGEIIRYARTVQTDRPFYRFVWEESLDQLQGTGVADNLQDQQKVTNGVWRAIEDNIKQSANIVWAMREHLVKNSPKSMRPGLVLLLKETARSIEDAIHPLVTPDVTAPLMNLFAMVLQMNDNASLIPRIQQGMAADTSRDPTAREVMLQASNSSKYLGAVIRRMDEQLIEPVGAYFYDYAMTDPSVPDDMKGNFVVQGTGFQSYHDRILQVQNILQVLSIAAQNPQMAVNTNFRKLQVQIARAMDLDETDILNTPEEAAQIMNAMQTTPMQLAQTAKAQAEARKANADATKTMQDVLNGQQEIKMKLAQTAQKLREGAAAGRQPSAQPAAPATYPEGA